MLFCSMFFTCYKETNMRLFLTKDMFKCVVWIASALFKSHDQIYSYKSSSLPNY